MIPGNLHPLPVRRARTPPRSILKQRSKLAPIGGASASSGDERVHKNEEDSEQEDSDRENTGRGGKPVKRVETTAEREHRLMQERARRRQERRERERRPNKKKVKAHPCERFVMFVVCFGCLLVVSALIKVQVNPHIREYGKSNSPAQEQSTVGLFETVAAPLPASTEPQVSTQTR
mmetsp:Transcript_845/g.1732  ORF Transcript_845/g.1732 Transcript_845/m.1732 type:complete len:176 (+) Transcript_845:141-668(+)